MLEPPPAWTDMGLKSYSYYRSYGARLTAVVRYAVNNVGFSKNPT